jgi:hypothetical protein
MPISWRPWKPDERWNAVGWAGVAALVPAGAWLLARYPHLSPGCSLRTSTGVPCPTCGTTAAAGALLEGRLLDALALNPLVVLGGAALFLWAAVSALTAVLGLPGPRLHMGRRAVWTLAALVVLNWAYLVLRGA